MPSAKGEPVETQGQTDAEGRYARFFARVPIGLYRTAPNGRILDANPFLASMLGYPSRESLLSENAIDIHVDPEDRRRQQRLLHKDGLVRNYRMRLRRLDGAVIWVEDNCHIIRDAAGEVLYHEGSLQDISEQVGAQLRLTEFNKCFLDFGSDPLTNINRLAALCGELLAADSVVYSRVENGLLTAWAQWHTPLDFNPVCDPEGRLCTDVIRSRASETLLVRDLQASTYAETDPMVRAMGIRTYVGQAVKAADGSVGSLGALYRRDVAPSAEDSGILKFIAVAIGIEEKRRVAEATTARQARQMASLYETSLEIGAQRDVSLLLNAVVRRAASMVGAPMGGLHLADATGEYLELVVNYNLPEFCVVGSRIKLGEQVTGRVARSGEPLMLTDVAAHPGAIDPAKAAAFRRVLGVPLKIGSQVLGVLLVADDVQAERFTEDDVRLVTLFADQAAIALENTRLYSAAERELAERRRAEQALRVSEERYRRLFEDSPVSLWEEDFSALKGYIDELRARGVTDLAAHFAENPQDAARCPGLVSIVDVNRSTLKLFAARSKDQLIGNLGSIMPRESMPFFIDEMLALASGKTLFEGEALNRTMTGAQMDVSILVSVAPGHEESWSKVIVSVVDITQQKRAEDRLRFLSTHDVLTGLYNRAFFEEETTRMERGRHYPISVLMVDVDYLKVTNDRRGHAAGDSLLRRAAAVLRAAFRTEDVVARIGGDEFAVLLPGVDASAAEETLDRVKAALAAHNNDRDGTPLSLSMGVATAEKGSGLAAALTAADALMYQDKEAHRAERAIPLQPRKRGRVRAKAPADNVPAFQLSY